MLVKVENGVAVKWPLSEAYLQVEHPNTSFSFPLSDDVLWEFGYARLEYKDPDHYDPLVQDVEELAPVVSGIVATQSWRVVEKYTAEEKEKVLEAAQQGEANAMLEANKEARNQKLSETDWTQLADVDLTADCKTAFAAYRKELRSIDLLNPVWPEVPEEVWA